MPNILKYIFYYRVFKELREKSQHKPPLEVTPIEEPKPTELEKPETDDKPDDSKQEDDEIVIDVEKPIEPEPIPVLPIPEVKKTELEELVSWLHGKIPLNKEQLEGLCINMCDFEVALKSVQPSAKREGFATVPDVTWDDVGSLKDIREELQMSILVKIILMVW